MIFLIFFVTSVFATLLCAYDVKLYYILDNACGCTGMQSKLEELKQ